VGKKPDDFEARWAAALEKVRRPTLVRNPSPGVPVSGPVLNDRNVASLLNSVPSDQREAYRFLLAEIQRSRVRFGDFRTELNKTAKAFAERNPDLVGEPDKFVAYSHSRGSALRKKSNLWTLELLMQKKNEVNFPNAVVSFPEPRNMLEKIRASGIRDVLVTDDASYSGTQLEGVLQTIAKESQGNPPLTIHVVVPYMTAKAEAVLKSAIPGLTVKIYPHQNLPSFDSVLRAAVSRGAIAPATEAQVRKLFFVDDYRTVVSFDHKLPDFLSTIINQGPGGGGSVLNDIRVIQPDGKTWKTFEVANPVEAPYDPSPP
jgi:hypothetical protein